MSFILALPVVAMLIILAKFSNVATLYQTYCIAFNSVIMLLHPVDHGMMVHFTSLL